MQAQPDSTETVLARVSAALDELQKDVAVVQLHNSLEHLTKRLVSLCAASTASVDAASATSTLLQPSKPASDKASVTQLAARTSCQMLHDKKQSRVSDVEETSPERKMLLDRLLSAAVRRAPSEDAVVNLQHKSGFGQTTFQEQLTAGKLSAGHKPQPPPEPLVAAPKKVASNGEPPVSGGDIGLGDTYAMSGDLNDTFGPGTINQLDTGKSAVTMTSGDIEKLHTMVIS